jgi:hypothetical protein
MFRCNWPLVLLATLSSCVWGTSAQALVECDLTAVLPPSFQVRTSADAALLGSVAACNRRTIAVSWSGAVILQTAINIGPGTVLSIIGDAKNSAIADGGEKVRLFNVWGTLSVQGLIMRNAFQSDTTDPDALYGGAVLVRPLALAQLSAVTFANNKATYGAGKLKPYGCSMLVVRMSHDPKSATHDGIC